jgi:hypothetical protein
MPQQIAEGSGDETLRQRAAYRPPESQQPAWLRFIVLDVISDPTQIDSIKLSHWEHDLGVANIQYATIAPRNSIIARRVMGNGSGASEKVVVLWPGVPSHISMPAKPGEHVWGFFENPVAKSNDLGYWLWKIAQPHHVDDQNYTHADRTLDPSFVPGLSDVFEGTADPKYEFHNGAVGKDTESGDRYVIGDTSTAPGDDTFYPNLLQNSDAGKIAQYEAVPRYRKRPQDVAFEGSNNTLIVLGTDRTGPLATYTQDPNKGMVPGPVTADIAGGGAGAIDIVAGRGQTQATGGTPVSNTLNNKEIGKDKANLQVTEGDVDWINDRSRVLTAQKTKIDTNLNITNVVSAHSSQSSITDGNGEGGIVVKTDKVRIIARHDVIILVTAATATDANGNVQDPGTGGATVDSTKCASIILRANGDIVFTPSSTGVIRLGGDDATLSPLCTRVGNSAGMPSPIPPPSPIVDTMGGSQGGADGLNGTFATKVLLK